MRLEERTCESMRADVPSRHELCAVLFFSSRNGDRLSGSRSGHFFGVSQHARHTGGRGLPVQATYIEARAAVFCGNAITYFVFSVACTARETV